MKLPLVLSACLCATATVVLAEPAFQFSDVSETAGLADFAVNSTGPAFSDFDNEDRKSVV